VDAIDYKILAILQEDVSASVADVASRVGLSQTPCWKRIQKLESTGVITRRVAILSPEAVGLGLTVYVSIVVGEHSEAWLESFTHQINEIPEVVELYRMAGDVDYMLKVVAADIAQFDEFYKKLLKISTFKNVASRFAMERIKSTTALPLNSHLESCRGHIHRKLPDLAAQ
jgi:Lrp/AsnC family transcriptional regulator